MLINALQKKHNKTRWEDEGVMGGVGIRLTLHGSSGCRAKLLQQCAEKKYQSNEGFPHEGSGAAHAQERRWKKREERNSVK